MIYCSISLVYDYYMSPDTDHTPASLLIETLTGTISPTHPLPIYLQIAATVRDEIAAGRLPIGTLLPSVRALGHALGINYHTVRHAWDSLVEEGVLSVRRGRGARVVAAPTVAGQWRLTLGGPEAASAPVVWVVSSVWRHAAAIARQLMDSWAIVAAPWPTAGHMPPPGVILMLDATPAPEPWTARRSDQHHLPSALPRDAVARIRRAAGLLDTRDVQIATSPALGGDAALLRRQLPRVGLTVLPDPDGANPVLPDDARLVVITVVGAHELVSSDDPRVLVLERCPAAGPIAGLARECGWQSM